MTERLYYSDSFLFEFEASVTAVREVDGRTAVVLDRSAFYPSSGGQVNDTGWLGWTHGRVRVADVAEDESGEVLHFLDGMTPENGAIVRGMIDVARRRDHMQQHSGQHVLSAAFVRLLDMPTVSFHMGDETCSIDLATTAVKPEHLERVSELANQVVFEDRPVEIRFATVGEARAQGVRKLPDHVEGELRLIDIRGFDLNACGGTHVRATGQIGPILLRKLEKVRQGVRVEFVCGERAVAIARRDFTTLTEAAALYSAHIWDVPQQVRKSLEDVKAAGKQQHRLLEEIAELMAARLVAETEAQKGVKLIQRVFADRDTAFIKLLAQKMTATARVVALLGSTAGQPSLVFAESAGLPFDLGALMKQAVATAGGRGGGSREMAQGGVPGATDMETILRESAARLGNG